MRRSGAGNTCKKLSDCEIMNFGREFPEIGPSFEPLIKEGFFEVHLLHACNTIAVQLGHPSRRGKNDVPKLTFFKAKNPNLKRV